MDRRHAEANSKFTPDTISRHRVYLYYKTAINSGVHYHKLDRHRVVHVSDGMLTKRNSMYYNKAPGLFTMALFLRPRICTVSKVVGPDTDRIDMLLKKIKSSLYLADAFPATPPLLLGNCFPIGFICSLRLVSSRLVKVARLTRNTRLCC